MEIKAIDKEYVAGTYGRFPLEIVRGRGAKLWDSDGKEYTDLGSGIAVNTFGYSDEEWVAAVTSQLSKLQHTSNLYYTEPCALLAKMLCERTGMKKVFFSNSGAEANECAIKVARKYAFLKNGNEEKSNIITLKNSFHGRTVTTIAATGQDSFHTDFGPFPAGFEHCEANNTEMLSEMVASGRFCAVMLETVQGEGGVNTLTDEFVLCADKLCRENGMLLIVDEVQTGNGRSGKLYSYMHYGIQPDVVSTAKGLAGGLPMGATLLSEKVENVLTPGSHGSTFGGNPVCAAGAVNVISRLDEEMLCGVCEREALIRQKLSACKNVVSITGRGLMLGVECTKEGREIANRAIESGVLVLTAKNKVRLLPPLNIPMAELEAALDKLCAIIEE
ncbi:MAG: aspartate aminotransferase family protein [Clostridia bacterium]|nr:aspartate aminotransferase family protein [Clostridia bacterium]